MFRIGFVPTLTHHGNVSNTTQSDPGTSETTPPVPFSSQPPRRMLQRSREHRVLGGVAGGVSEYFGVDVVIVRIAFVVLACMAGSGVLAYIAAWIFLPRAPSTPVSIHQSPPSRFGDLDGHQLLAIALVGIGAIALFDRIGIGIGGDVLLPFVLIGIGVAVLMSSKSPPTGKSRSTSGASPGGSRGAGPGESPGHISPDEPVLVVGAPTSTRANDSGPTGTALVQAEQATSVLDAFDLLRAPRAHEFDAGSLLSPPPPPEQRQTNHPDPGKRRGRRHRTPFARTAFGMFLVMLGVLIVATRAGFVDGRVDRLFACALFLVGALLVIGARMGRPRGFTFLGVLLTLFLGLFAITDATWRGGFGERFETPRSMQDVRDEYNLAGGVMHLDFSKIDFSGKRKTINVDVSAGAVAIELPADVRVVTRAAAGLGEITVFGRSWSGSDVKRRVVEERNGDGTIELNAHVGFGALEIARVGKLRKLTDLRQEKNEKVNVDLGQDTRKEPVEGVKISVPTDPSDAPAEPLRPASRSEVKP